MDADAAQSLDDFDTALDRLESELQPYLTTPLSARRAGAATLVDAAQENLVHVFALDSLMFMYLKTRGLSVDGHVIKRELDRLRPYFARVKEVAQKAAGGDAAGGGSGGVRQDTRTSKVDVQAAQRFVAAGLGARSSSGAAAAAAAAATGKGQAKGKGSSSSKAAAGKGSAKKKRPRS